MTAYPTNITLTKNDGSTTLVVTVSGERVTENMTKALTVITFPKGTDNQGIAEGSSTSKIVDLLMKCEHRFTVRGALVSGLGPTDTHSDAYDKKLDLQKIFKAGMANRELVYLDWENVSGTGTARYQVALEKCDIDWNKPRDQAEVGTDQYEVQFTAVMGEAI
jgi:hypothetical protein